MKKPGSLSNNSKPNTTIACACGCGSNLNKFDSKGRPRKFIKQHHARLLRTHKWKDARSKRMTGVGNHQWINDRSLVGRLGQGFSKKQVKKLLKDMCKVCGARVTLELDHIKPIFAGGTNSDANAQTLCRPCNQNKRKSDLITHRSIAPLRKIANPNYLANLSVNSEGYVLLQLSKRGVLGRPGTRLRAVRTKCGNCKKSILKSLWVLQGSNARPAPKRSFCGERCRLSFLNTRKTGKNNPFWGKRHTESSRSKISTSRTGKAVGNINALGYKHNPKAISQISAASTRMWKLRKEKRA